MSFVEQMIDGLRARAHQPAVIEVDGAHPRPVSGQEMVERIARARSFLRGIPVAPGDRVALLAPNSAHWLAADLAILAEGAICVPLYARQAPKELAGMLADCTPKLLVCAERALAQEVLQAGAQCQVVTFEELFAADAVAGRAAVALEPQQPVTLIYTSGTSGEPKGVVYTAANVQFMLPVTAGALDELTAHRPGEDRVFHYLPLCFAGSRIAAWTQLARRNPLWLSTNLDNLVQELATAKPHYFLNVPALLERVRRGVTSKVQEAGGVGHALLTGANAAHRRLRNREGSLADRLVLAAARRLVFPKIRAAIGPNLEFLICGSAPLSEDTQRWFEMIGIPVYQVYGLTETTGIVTMDRPHRARPGFVGVPIAGVELKIASDGELLCKGPNIFTGYWNKPPEAREDGWFPTGDRAEVDEQGRYRILGRTKNLLVPESGHNVAPEPLEEALLATCPGLTQAVVVGHGRPFLSVIVAGEASEQEIERALEAVNRELPHYKRIRKFLRAEEPFSPENGLLTANQKLKRPSIERRYQAALAQVYP